MSALTAAGTGLSATACGGVYGGIRTLYAIPAEEITSMTIGVGSDHDYTAITFDASIFFEEINFERNQAEFKESDTRGETSVDTNIIEINFNVTRMDKAQRFVIEEMKGHCQMVWVCRLFTDDFMVAGYDAVFGTDAYVKYGSTEYTSGRARPDANQGVLTFTAEHSELARMWTGLSGTAEATDLVCELLTGVVCP